MTTSKIIEFENGSIIELTGDGEKHEGHPDSVPIFFYGDLAEEEQNGMAEGARVCSNSYYNHYFSIAFQNALAQHLIPNKS